MNGNVSANRSKRMFHLCEHPTNLKVKDARASRTLGRPWTQKSLTRFADTIPLCSVCRIAEKLPTSPLRPNPRSATDRWVQNEMKSRNDIKYQSSRFYLRVFTTEWITDEKCQIKLVFILVGELQANCWFDVISTFLLINLFGKVICCLQQYNWSTNCRWPRK